MAEAPQPKDAKHLGLTDDQEIKVLERRLQLLREGLKPADASKVEVKELRDVVEDASQGELPQAPPPVAASAPLAPPLPPADQHFHDAKTSELKDYETDKQLKALVEIAVERSLKDAVDIARRLDDAHLLDEFHDLLKDDDALHKMLIEQGKLTEG